MSAIRSTQVAIEGDIAMRTDLDHFTRAWEHETEGTLALLRALPTDQYDFRPDPGARSLGELAWHLAEIDAYATRGIEQGEFKFEVKPPHLERPRTVEALAPGFQLVHADAAARVARLRPEDMERETPYAEGVMWSIHDLLWKKLLLHAVHHRGQLVVLCRLAGGRVPGLFGRTREG